MEAAGLSFEAESTPHIIIGLEFPFEAGEAREYLGEPRRSGAHGLQSCFDFLPFFKRYVAVFKKTEVGLYSALSRDFRGTPVRGTHEADAYCSGGSVRGRGNLMRIDQSAEVIQDGFIK